MVRQGDMGLQGRYLWCARSGRYCGGITLVLLQTASVRRNEKIARHYGGKARRTSPTSLTCRHLQCRSDSEVTSRLHNEKSDQIKLIACKQKMVRPRGLDKAAEPPQSQPVYPAGNPSKMGCKRGMQTNFFHAQNCPPGLLGSKRKKHSQKYGESIMLCRLRQIINPDQSSSAAFKITITHIFNSI